MCILLNGLSNYNGSRKKNLFGQTSIWLGSVLVALIAMTIFISIPIRELTPSDKQPTKLFYIDNISTAHQQVIDRFNKKFEGRIKVVPVDLPFFKFSTNERKEILARALRSKSDRIDIFAVDIIWAPRFAKWGHPLDRYFDDNTLNSINPFALESCYFENHLMALPHYLEVGVMYYRKDIISRLPDGDEIISKLENSIDWEEFIALGRRLKSGNKPFYLFPANNYEGFICSYHEMLNSEQSDAVFAGDSVKLNLDPSRAGLQFLHNLIYKEQLTPAAVTRYDELKCLQYFLENDGLFVRGWPGYKKNRRSEFASEEEMQKIGVVALPHFKNNPNNAVFGGWNLMISKYSAKKKEAIEFIKFTQEIESQEIMYLYGGYSPVNKAVYTDSAFISQNPDLEYMQQLFYKGRHRPFRNDYTKISDIMSYYFQLALKDEIPIDEALRQASDKINSKQVFIR